tara:strand:+ start:106 stop:981 length:876 start_codon:yes stop_codon:yes gene_type:complete
MELYLTEQQIELKKFYECKNIISTDCDLYNIDTGELIFSFKKNVVPKEHYNLDKKVITYASEYSNNRGDAAGITNINDLKKGMEHWKNHPVEVIDKHGNPLPEDHQQTTSFIKMKNGVINKRKRSNQAMSNSIGGYDKSNVYPCRLTNWTKKNIEEYKSLFPLSKCISDLYFSYVPDKWLYQYEKYSKSPKEFVIPETNFSTLTINRDWRTAAHKDRGDCKEGLTAFTVKELDIFEGGELCFPNYDIGIDIREGDLLLFDPHVTHCNNKLTKNGRVSFVFYLREKLDKCEG